MNNKIPTARELSSCKAEADRMIEFARLHVKAALKAAAKNAKISLNGCCYEEEFDCSAQIDKKPILNAYPENLIK